MVTEIDYLHMLILICGNLPHFDLCVNVKSLNLKVLPLPVHFILGFMKAKSLQK